MRSERTKRRKSPESPKSFGARWTSSLQCNAVEPPSWPWDRPHCRTPPQRSPASLDRNLPQTLVSFPAVLKSTVLQPFSSQQFFRSEKPRLLEEGNMPGSYPLCSSGPSTVTDLASRRNLQFAGPEWISALVKYNRRTWSQYSSGKAHEGQNGWSNRGLGPSAYSFQAGSRWRKQNQLGKA